MHQTNTIPNSAGMKELKAMNILKQCRDNFQFGGKDKLNLKVFFTSPKRDLQYFCPQMSRAKHVTQI